MSDRLGLLWGRKLCGEMIYSSSREDTAEGDLVLAADDLVLAVSTVSFHN